MAKNQFTFWGLLPPRNDDDLTWVLRNCIIGLLLFTFALMAFVAGISCINWVNRIIAFLAVAGACVLCGGVAGFLFGIPRADKNRYKPDADHSASVNYYSDNTNLEEISDWLTKIIVGLTLIKFRTILDWLNQAANTVSKTLAGQDNCGNQCGKYYVFSYGTILIYLLAGGMMAYLWTRINFSKILTLNRKHLKDIEMSEAEKAEGLKKFNSDLAENSQKTLAENIITPSFKELVMAEYKSRTIKDKTDIQKGRWGGQNKKNKFVLDADVEKKKFYPGLFMLKITITAPKKEFPYKGAAAIFLHSTFPEEIVFVPFNEIGVATLELTCYEAFVVGAYLEDKTELELDLNEVVGYPEGFYWTK